MRVALYARFSSDQQNPRSADDQLAALRIILAARGFTEAGAYADEGISGANRANRPAVQRLLADAAAPDRGFDLVMAEALDRISRDQEDTAHIFKRLSFHGVALETLSEGRITAMHVGMAGTMNQLFLEELGKKTRRGLVARVKAGKSGGGRCYGYAIPPQSSVQGKGELEVDPAEAEVVRRIFADYDRGLSPRAIARALNAEGAPGARGGEWTASAINGDRRAQDGILHQSLYVGERVFNRRRFRKHPDTGRRSGVLNPPEQWIREPVPALRILDQDLWDRVQARKAALSATPLQRTRRPKRLLSGLLRCGLCDGAMTLIGPRYACVSRRERGTCANDRYAAAAELEARVVDGLRGQLLSPDAVDRAVRAFHAGDVAERQAAIQQRAGAEARLAEIRRRINRLVIQMEEGAAYADVRERMEALAADRDAQEAVLAACAAPPIQQLHPSAARRYAELAGMLGQSLDGDDAQEVREALRGLIEQVVFTPASGRGQYQLEVRGELRRLLADPRTTKAPDAGAPGADVVESLGAGTRSGRNHHKPAWVFAA